MSSKPEAGEGSPKEAVDVRGDGARSGYTHEGEVPVDTTDHGWGGGVHEGRAAEPTTEPPRESARAQTQPIIRASARAPDASGDDEDSDGGWVTALLAGAVVLAVGGALLWWLNVL